LIFDIFKRPPSSGVMHRAKAEALPSGGLFNVGNRGRAMAQDDENFNCGFRFLSHEETSALQDLRAQYEVRLIETRHAVERDGWVPAGLGRVISRAAQTRLADVLIEMVETLYETAARAYFSAVGSSQYKVQVDSVERQLLDYALERWRQLTRGLALERSALIQSVLIEPDEMWLADMLAARLRSKALELELQMWQKEASFDWLKSLISPAVEVGHPNQSVSEKATTASNSPVVRRYGFEANMDRHKAIAEIVSKHAPNWREDPTSWKTSDVLSLICTDLDVAMSSDESGLYEIPESWKMGKPESLGGAPARGWLDALTLAPKKFISDQIGNSLLMVRKSEMKESQQTQDDTGQ
jgi:hypothetical protein